MNVSDIDRDSHTRCITLPGQASTSLTHHNFIMNLTWTVLSLGFLLSGYQGQMKFPQRCCNYGKELVRNSSIIGSTTVQTCSTEKIKNYIISRNDKVTKTRTCAAFARSCCQKLLKAELCRVAAMVDEDCESITDESNSYMNELKLECCLCCQRKNPISMDTFDNCKLLNGKCPQKFSKTITTQLFTSMETEKEANSTWSATTSSIDTTTTDYNSLNNTMSSNDTTDSWGPSSNDTGASMATDTNTTNSTVAYTSSTMTSSRTTIIIGDITTRTSKPILCDSGYLWDSRLQVCVQMMISCPQNFVLHPDSKRCVSVVVPTVPCSSGFIYDQFKNLCLDIDECLNLTICTNRTQKCVNIIGSYTCDCVKGFKLNKLGQCEDIDECQNSNICPEDKKCKNKIGTYRCVRAIPCGFGWKEDSETNECVDIDECESFPDICGVGMTCVNIRGSHKCEDEECPNNMRRNNKGKCSHCRDGFNMNNITNECEDIDECTEKAHLYKGRCKDSENCVNLPGSYECVPKKKCRPGTLLTKNGTSCEDIDECKEMVFRCDSDDICINTYSSYQCVASPCAPSQYYDYGTERCYCKDGYRQSSENNCEDIDECSDTESTVQCGSMFRCVNKPGGYMCINKINCTKGMYRPSANSICQDIDECETGEGKCPTNMHCVNMVGSFKCLCDRGFIMIKNNSCADINECLLFRPEESCPDLEARCVNTPGSYKCQCPKGFEWSDYPAKKCIDIDECQSKTNPCGSLHSCHNVIGSYRCQCHPGYRLTVAGDKCEDIDECSIVPKKCQNGRCINIPGRYSCQCPKGFVSDNNEVCQDIDECLSFQGMCPISETTESSKRCMNLFGYYKCVNNSCDSEYSMTQLGNGYICTLNQAHHCQLSNVQCLRTRPYRRSLQFFEISPDVELPRTLTRVNIGHLPPGNQQINLQVKYAHHSDTKEPISIQNAFHLSRGRNRREEIEVILRYMVAAPAEVLLYLQASIYHREMYLGNSEAYIYLYFTKYPDTLI